MIGIQTTSKQPLSTEMSEVLDYFAPWPDCGYHPEAATVVRHYDTEVHETALYTGCVLSCGWGQVARTPTPLRSGPAGAAMPLPTTEPPWTVSLARRSRA
ncbi:hypothetical protein ACWEKT_20950 [Nocardia takedensis]